jgi:hypothetical protein
MINNIRKIYFESPLIPGDHDVVLKEQRLSFPGNIESSVTFALAFALWIA